IVVRQRSQDQEIAAVSLPKGDFVRLRIASTDGSTFRFAFAPVEGAWTEIAAEMDGKFLPPWDRAIRVGLEAKGPKGAASKFAYFSLSPDGSQLFAVKAP